MKTKKVIAVIMAVLMVALCFSACGKKGDDANAKDDSKVKAKTVVAEKGSVGEEVINSDEYFANMTKTPVDTQQKALTEVKAGTADMAVIDYIMALGSTGEGTDYADLKINTETSFAKEYYGIAFRKGSNACTVVNQAIVELYADGTLKKIAEKYKIADMLVAPPSTIENIEATEADWEYIKEKGELVIGITLFPPMDYYNENNELVGFEVEFGKAVCEKIGVEAKFQEISWEAKETELNAKNIDCIWNGLSINDERKATMQISIPYMENKQVIITK